LFTKRCSTFSRFWILTLILHEISRPVQRSRRIPPGSPQPGV